MDRILIADDEAGIVRMLGRYFGRKGYEVVTAMDGEEAVLKAGEGADLILLDINMPGMDGVEVCRRIRESVRCPILFLTARVELEDRILGLQSGGDDYIVKPFDLDELGARVEAHLRREKRKDAGDGTRTFGELTVNFRERTVSAAGTQVPLSRREFDILSFLCRYPGQVFDRERIYEAVWGLDGSGNSDTVMEHVRKIRMKLAAYTDREFLETVWGCGYRWKK